MEGKIKKVFLSLFLMCAGIVWAQSASYYIRSNSEDGDDSKSEIVQRFSWEGSEDALKYEFTIEVLNKNGVYEKKDFIETQDNWVEQTLTAGEYRYKIAVYNFLGVKEIETGWQQVSIVKAYLPEIKDASPSIIYLEEVQTGIFSLSGNELRPDAKYYLRHGSTKIYAEIIETDEKNKHVKIYFNPDELDTGKYNLVAENLGGLTDSFDFVNIRFKKPVDFDLSGRYTVPVILFDSTISDYMKHPVWPLSVSAKASFFPFKSNGGYIGVQVNGFYIRMFADHNNYEIKGNLAMGNLNFVYQLPIRKLAEDQKTKKLVMTIELHGGVGLTYFMDYKFFFPHSIITDPLNSLNLDFDVGVGTQIYLTNRLFIDTDIDFSMAFIKDMQFGVLLPSIGVGWQF